MINYVQWLEGIGLNQFEIINEGCRGAAKDLKQLTTQIDKRASSSFTGMPMTMLLTVDELFTNICQHATVYGSIPYFAKGGKQDVRPRNAYFFDNTKHFHVLYSVEMYSYVALI